MSFLLSESRSPCHNLLLPFQSSTFMKACRKMKEILNKWQMTCFMIMKTVTQFNPHKNFQTHSFHLTCQCQETTDFFQPQPQKPQNSDFETFKEIHALCSYYKSIHHIFAGSFSTGANVGNFLWWQKSWLFEKAHFGAERW